MASLKSHHSSTIVKLLYIGDSGTGKTGSLTSLVQAGYKLRILDLDNGLDVLKAFIDRECPDKIDLVDYETRRDKYKGGKLGPVVDGTPKALVESLSLMNEWTDKTVPASWGPETVFVLDSLTGLGKAAFEWAKAMSPLSKEPRQWYHTAQQAVDNFISLVTSEAFKTNVIVICHIHFQEGPDGLVKGYPNTIGKAIGPIVPTYFNNFVMSKSSGSGNSVKRTISTVPTAMLDLKNTAPFRVEQTLPLETGLATLFNQLKGKVNG